MKIKILFILLLSTINYCYSQNKIIYQHYTPQNKMSEKQVIKKAEKADE